jgi:hypothetical protein
MPVMTALLITLLAGGGLTGVNLVAPDFEVTEGDRMVQVTWTDPAPESLVVVNTPVLGTIQFPWNGNADVASDGFYTGACDWMYTVTIDVAFGNVELTWPEVADWETQSVVDRRMAIAEMDSMYELSDGIRIGISSEGLLDTVLAGWTGPTPEFSGLYVGESVPDPSEPVTFTVTCNSGGVIDAGGDQIGFSWTNDIEGSGSFTIDSPDSRVEISEGFKVAFPAGTVTAGESFTVEVQVPLVESDRFVVSADTFDGYLVLRHSVEDRPGQYKVVANFDKCENYDFFTDQEGTPDPYGQRVFVDEGIDEAGPGIEPDPDFETVLNGFQYDYCVVTFDIQDDHSQAMSPLDWTQVTPAVQPAASASAVRVVPNPYVLRAGWETAGGESKLQFVNIPRSSVIRIYDAAGGYINTIRPNSFSDGSAAGTADWNLKDSDGEDVVSGIYIYKLESGVGEKYGRFIVVR